MRTSIVLASTALVVCGVGSGVIRSVVLDPKRAEDAHSAFLVETRSPGPRALAVLSIEHRLAAADLTWLGVIQEVGRDQKVSPASLARVLHGSDLATDLDPKYFTVYHSAGVNLAVYGHDVEGSERILLKGWKQLPNRWELPMLLGYVVYFMGGDAARASTYLEEASQLAGAPRFLAPLAGRMRYQAGDELGAIQLLEALAETVGDGPGKDDIEHRIIALRSEKPLSAFDSACRAYRTKNGQLPPDAGTLQREGWVDLEPLDGFGDAILLDENCIARSSSILVREFEAKRRIGSVTSTPTPELR